MLKREKDFILSQVASVLSDLQSLVSKLNSIQCHDEEEESKSDVTNISWDSSHDFPVYSTTPSAFYSLVFPESSDEEIEMLPVNDCQEKPVHEDSFVNKILNFISSNFPNNVYNEEKGAKIRKVQLNAAVCEDFHCMWNNVGDLLKQKPDSDENCTTLPPATPAIKYKSIDFAKVNVRNMANIPKPTSFPVYGCSPEPKFYTEVVKVDYWDYYGNQRTFESSFIRKAPFGSLYGYETNVGIVPVPDTPAHGHVWSDQLHNWVLHAVFPEECSATRAPSAGSRFPTTSRPPSTRRGGRTSRPRREGKG